FRKTFLAKWAEDKPEEQASVQASVVREEKSRNKAGEEMVMVYCNEVTTYSNQVVLANTTCFLASWAMIKDTPYAAGFGTNRYMLMDVGSDSGSKEKREFVSKLRHVSKSVFQSDESEV